MATTSGYDTGIRQALVQKGISNADIGFNPGTGYVTVKGQNAIKAPKQYGGSAYTSQQGFNTDWDAYSKSLQQPKQTGIPQTGATGTTPLYMKPPSAGYQPAGVVGAQQAVTGYQPPVAATQGMGYGQGTTAGYTPQAAPTIDQRIADLYAYAQNQQAFDPYSSSAYQAAQAQAQRAAQQGIRQAQEALGTAGFGRSTTLGESAQRIGQEGTEYLMTQVLPQIQAQEQARRQQEFQNLMSLLTPQQQQQQFAEQTAQGRAGLTGSFISPEAQQTINQLMGLKQQAEAQGITRDARAGLSSQADVLRNQLLGMGVDPSLFGAGVTSAQATQNIGRVGTPTLAGQAQQLARQGQQFEQQFAQEQFAYQQARDAIADERYKAEFDEDARRYGLDYALNKQVQLGNLAVNQAQEARVAANQAGGGGGSAGGSSGYKPSAEKTIQDINLPRTAATMETYIISKLPGGKNVFGPPSPNQQELIENMILDNPNLSEADMVKLYKKFGIPLPE